MATIQQNDAASTLHRLAGSRLTIGRQEDNDVVLGEDMRVSRHHAEIESVGGEWTFRDLQSRNGSTVNGKPVTEVTLRDGDRIKIGASSFVFSAEADPLATIMDTQASDAGVAPHLSAREGEILVLLARGSTDQQIAGALFISPATVRSHLDRIRDKTGCRRRSELTRLALDLGLDV